MENNIVDWQSDLNALSVKYFKIASWVALILNPLWTLSDYFVTPENWFSFCIIRCSISIFVLALLLIHNKKQSGIELFMFLSYTALVIQNGYFYSFMELEMFQQQTFAMLAILIGGGMLMLWRMRYSIALVILCLLSIGGMFYLNSPLSFDEIVINGGLLNLTVAFFLIFLIQTRYRLHKKEIISRLSLETSNDQLVRQKNIIEIKNEEITDSITYARRIQEAILPSRESINACINDCFVYYQPKDIVAGDFYWIEETPKGLLVGVADCTGHGVPGAMVSVVCNNALNRAVREYNLYEPAAILDKVTELVINTFEQSATEIMDGMDIALCRINKDGKSIEFAGANNPLWIFDKDRIESQIIKGCKQPIGRFLTQKPFKGKTIPVNPGNILYLFTDGFADQFGGKRGKKYKYKPFNNLLSKIKEQKMSDQLNAIQSEFETWKDDFDQIDDVCVVGIRL